jgi:hypothetical protein
LHGPAVAARFEEGEEMNNPRRTKTFLILGIAALACVVASEVIAVPTFARRYSTSCATCHQAYPRLNSVGESFRLMGYQFVDDERYRKQQPVELGDEAYKRLWPKALWPTEIPRNSPLSFMGRFMVETDLDGSRPATFTFLLPEEVELVWAGNVGSKMSFYGDAIFLQKDFGGEEPDSWATLKAWLQFQSLFGGDNKFNLRLGTVGTQTMGLFTARDANFYGTHFYLYTSWFMPQVNLEQAGLASFKGNNFSIGPQMGVELNGVGKHWYYAVGVVNGDLQVPAGTPPPSDVSFVGMGSTTSSKDFYTQLAYKVGGMSFDRNAEEGPENLGGQSQFWRDDSWIFTLFGYRGTADIESVYLDGTEMVERDNFWRLGLGVQKQIKDFSISAAYVAGGNDNPYGSLSDASVDSATYHVEVLAWAYPWLIPYGRFEGLSIDMPDDVPGLSPEQDIERVMIGAKFMIRPNVFCVVETAHYTKGDFLEEGFDKTLFVLLSASF